MGEKSRAAAVPRVGEGWECAIDRCVRVGAVGLGDASSNGFRVGVAKHKAGGHVRLVVAADEGVVERDLGDLACTAFLPAVPGCIAAALHAFIAPGAKGQMRGSMCVPHRLRRGTWVAARPGSAGLFCWVLRLVRLGTRFCWVLRLARLGTIRRKFNATRRSFNAFIGFWCTRRCLFRRVQPVHNAWS